MSDEQIPPRRFSAGSRNPAPSALLRSLRPELIFERLEYLAEGDFCRAYLLDGERVLRVPRHAQAERALEREACLLRTIAGALPVPVPAPEYLPPAAEGVGLSLHDALIGRPLTRELWLGRPAGERRHLAHQLGSFLRSLHGIDLSDAGECGLERIDHEARTRALVERLQAEGPGTQARQGGRDDAAQVTSADAREGEGTMQQRLLPADLRLALHERLVRWADELAQAAPAATVLHADVSPGHVLVDPVAGRITGIIDWGDACIGDPARDFIFLYEDWGGDFLRLALQGYDPDDAARFRRSVVDHYIVDQLEWTLDVADTPEAVRHGVDALRRALDER